MSQHFEELWEQSENFNLEASKNTDLSSIIDGLILKINLYKALSLQTDIPGDDIEKIKSRTLGEILLTLSCISVKDNINVYEALGLALQYRSIDYFDQKHSD